MEEQDRGTRAEISLRDRFYYRKVHGFDPLLDRKWTNQAKNQFYYEVQFPLEHDPILFRAGVTITARVDVESDVVRNRIIFRRGKRQTTVNCIHTAVCTLNASEAFQKDLTGTSVLEWARTTEHKKVSLSAEEHFASLKSYVAGIASMGIHNLMAASYESEDLNPETLPFGFNSAMQRQVMSALRRLAPKQTELMVQDFIAELVDVVPRGWLLPRVDILDSIYRIKKFLPPEFLPPVPEPRKVAATQPRTWMPNFKLKVLLLGRGDVGKEMLLRNVVQSNFSVDYKLTVGVAISAKNIEYQPGEVATITFWDVGSQQRFDFIRATFYSGAAGSIFIFDLSRPESWEQARAWLEEVRAIIDDVPFLVIGNRLEILEERGELVDREAIRDFVTENGGMYLEARSNEDNSGRVEEAISELTRQMVDLRR